MSASVLPVKAARPSRIRLLEPVTLLWVALIAALLVLVAAPLIKLLVISFEEQDTGAFTIQNYFTAYGRQRYIDALRNSLLLGALSAADLDGHRRADGLGGLAHRHARQGLHLGDRAGRLHHAALSRRDRLDPAGRAEFGLDQRGLARGRPGRRTRW